MKIIGYILLVLGIMGAVGGMITGDFSPAGLSALAFFIGLVLGGNYLIKKSRLKESGDTSESIPQKSVTSPRRLKGLK